MRGGCQCVLGYNQAMISVTVDPAIHLGKPCIAGTRIPVESVRELLGDGLSVQDIIDDYYPDLTTAAVEACILPSSSPATADN